MTAIPQVFMRHKISESYCVFNGEYHECIKNVQNLKKKHRKSNIFHTKTSEKLNSLYSKKTVGILKGLKLEIF